MKEPTDEQVGKLAYEVLCFAIDRCKQEGYGWAFGFAVIERAWGATSTLFTLFEAVGYETVLKLGEALEKADAYDVLSQAEDTLKEKE